MATLEAMADPPATPSDLTVHHLERYWFHRRSEIKQRSTAPRSMGGPQRFGATAARCDRR